MPWYFSIYVALLIISLPISVFIVRQLQRDLLHPVGVLLSGGLSIAFVMSYFYPDVVPMQGVSTLVAYGFVLGWDGYSVFMLKDRLHEIAQWSEDQEPELDQGAILVGLLMMAPAYVLGALVCLRAVS